MAINVFALKGNSFVSMFASLRIYNPELNTGENTEVPRQKEWDKQLVKRLLFCERPKNDEGEVSADDLVAEAVVVVVAEAGSKEEDVEVADRHHQVVGWGLQANMAPLDSMDHDERISAIPESSLFYFPFTPSREESLLCRNAAISFSSPQISKQIDIGR